MTTDDDSGLVARFVCGDTVAFDLLFTKYQEYVYHIVYGIVGNAEESRDLTQDVFVQVYRSLPRFRQGSRFATWLYRIATNRAVDAARGPRQWRLLPLIEEPLGRQRAAEPEDEPAALFARGMEREAVQSVLMHCPPTHRQILVLRYYGELSLEEIAETLGCSPAAAKVRLHRARQVFKENYTAAYGTQNGDAPGTEDADATQPTR